MTKGWSFEECGINKYNYITNRSTIDDFIRIVLNVPSYDTASKVADIAKIYEDKYLQTLNSDSKDKEQQLKYITDEYNAMLIDQYLKKTIVMC